MPSAHKEGIAMQIHRLVTRTPLFAAAITIAAGLAAAPAAQAEDPIVKLVSAQNGKCLQPINGSSNAGDAVVQETCNGSDAQQWTSKPAHHQMNLVNRSSNLCLDARGGPTDGTPIEQWPCKEGKGMSNQFWSYGNYPSNLLSSGVEPNPWGYCIATPGDQDGLPMELRACGNDPSLFWNHPEG
jgi:ricin-type beta-trefoil lectin protein